MLACVCQPMETALLFKGGPPITMGPLGSNKPRHNTDVMKTLNMIPKSVHSVGDAKDSSPSLKSLPAFVDTSGNLLNLRKIEREAQSTKILVNPVCSDSFGTSDDSPSKSTNKKWKGKKKRLKIKNKTMNDDSDKNARRDGATEEKKSISCFKIKSHDKRTNDETKLAKENCLNENATNLMNTRPDLINYPGNERLVDESTMTDNALSNDVDSEKTDLVREHEVSHTLLIT
ncbi:unnamed protein product [Pieris brassicae]|uniref:Uncharacterized protein n=1 Tax=Pieris brassicae TaxID=7116 RepID=A0A9P0XHI2_PIEBR|nr:unnamed protein product [Pieris brassicae]